MFSTWKAATIVENACVVVDNWFVAILIPSIVGSSRFVVIFFRSLLGFFNPNHEERVSTLLGRLSLHSFLGGLLIRIISRLIIIRVDVGFKTRSAPLN